MNFFVINEFFCNCIAKEVLFEQIALNEILHAEQLLLSAINSLNKASGLLYNFVCFSTEHTPLLT